MDLQEFQRTMSDAFSDMSDFSMRVIPFGKESVALAYLSGFCAKEAMNRNILEPISRAYEHGNAGLPMSLLITNAKIEVVADAEAAKNAILSGNALVFREGDEGFGFSVFTKNEEGRAPSEPETENVIRGPHEGFTESGENNAMLLRRRLRTTALKKVSLSVGSLSKTDVSIMYLDGIADRKIVDEVIRRIGAIETDIVPDSGTIEIYLQDGTAPLYPTVGNSERPDKVAAKLSEGRVAILVDGSPVVLTVPFLFCEAFQVAEDYAKSPWYASSIRVLRFAAFLVALYLPALFVALFLWHKELLPDAMVALIEKARLELPFSVFFEVLLIFLIFETVREVGLRMPKAVGSAVGLVGSLILGDSAIAAGIASSPVMIVVALAAVCNFIVPPYMNSNILYRFAMIIGSGLFGLYGFFVLVVLSLFHMCAKNSIGVPYLSPVAPMDPVGLRDFLYMASVSEKGRAPVAITGKRILRGKRKEVRR